VNNQDTRNIEAEMTKTVVHIIYCTDWGYEKQYERLTAAILSAMPRDVEVTGEVATESGAFEISLNGQLISSKLKTGVLPADEDIIEMVRKAAEL